MNLNNSEDLYNNYIEKVLNIYRLSNKDSSILFNIKIENLKCYCSMSIIGINGDKQEFSDVILDFNNTLFPDFLDVLVKKFNEEINVKVKDIVNLDGDSLVAYRMVTENNDLFSIDGLSPEDANHLKEICNGDHLNESTIENKITDNHGIGSFKMFLLMLFIIIISFVGIVKFLG